MGEGRKKRKWEKWWMREERLENKKDGSERERERDERERERREERERERRLCGSQLRDDRGGEESQVRDGTGGVRDETETEGKRESHFIA